MKPDRPELPNVAAEATRLLKCRDEARVWEREAALVAGVVCDAARAAYLERPSITAYSAGPCLVILRQTFGPVEGLPHLVTEPRASLHQPDLAAACAAAGDRWPAVATALGLLAERVPQAHAVRTLREAGLDAEAAIALRAMSAPQIRRAIA